MVLAALGWILFVLFWYRVFLRTPTRDSAVGVLLVAVLLVVALTLTVAWIRHNLALSRRFGNRRSRPREVIPDWSRDALGRPVGGPPWEDLLAAGEVDVDIDPETGEKIYKAS